MPKNNLVEPLTVEDHPPVIKWIIAIALVLLVLVIALTYKQWSGGVAPGSSLDNTNAPEMTSAERQQIVELLNTPTQPITAQERARILELLESN